MSAEPDGDASAQGRPVVKRKTAAAKRRHERKSAQPAQKGKRREFTRADYDVLVEAFRETPGQCTTVAKKTGIHYRTVKRAWEQGWPRRGKSMVPIKGVIEAEQEEARARLSQADEASIRAAAAEAEARRKREEQARADAVSTREREALLVRSARNNALALNSSIRELAVGTHALAKRIRFELERLAAPVGVDGNGNEVYEKLDNPGAYVRLVQALASAMRQSNDASLNAMRMERLSLGQPEGFVGVQLSAETLRDAVTNIESGNRALQRLKERGLVVIPGGKAGEDDELVDAEGEESNEDEGPDGAADGADDAQHGAAVG